MLREIKQFMSMINKAENCTNTHTQTHTCKHTHTHTHIHTHNCFTARWILSGTTQVSQYKKKHSPTHTYPYHQSSFICFVHLLRSMASSLFNLCAWQSFCTVSIWAFFGPPLALAPSTSYSTHFFIQSLFSFRSTCPYHCNLFCCSTEIIRGLFHK